MTDHRELRRAEYRRLAIEAMSLAEASNLSHVRQKHILDARRWFALADLVPSAQL